MTFQTLVYPPDRAMCHVAAGEQLAFRSMGGRTAAAAHAPAMRANNGGRRRTAVAAGIMTRGELCGGP